METFVASNSDRHPTELASLRAPDGSTRTRAERYSSRRRVRLVLSGLTNEAVRPTITDTIRRTKSTETRG